MTGSKFFSFLSIFVHFVVAIFIRVFATSRYLYHLLVDFCHEYNGREDGELLYKVLHLPKTPKHVTVLLGDEYRNPTYQDLSNLVVWCLAAGVPYISFFDYKGVLNKNKESFKNTVEAKLSEGCSVIWHENQPEVHKNGFNGRKIHVKLLSNINGKSSIVDACKKLALSNAVEDIKIETVNECLRRMYEFPDPDLGIYFDGSFYLHNYPPWQVQITQFYRLDLCHCITLRSFVDVLVRYSRCEQRLGT